MNIFPDVISEDLKDKTFHLLSDYSRSDDLVYDVDNKYILKISKNRKRLLKEREVNAYLKGKLPVGVSCYFIVEGEYSYYQRTKIHGEPLCSKRFLDNPELLIELLAKAVKMLHSLDVSKCPIKSASSVGNTFIHGDLCLPNIIISDDNEIAGFIDLADGGVGDEWEDYAWSIWSLEYNLKSKEYTKKYLDLIGVEFDQEAYDFFIEYE